MELTINGDVKVLVESSLSVSKLLVAESVKDPDMVSVQLNGEFVDRAKFPETVVSNGDEVDFLYFMGGGQ